jgi:hypothetical protein
MNLARRLPSPVPFLDHLFMFQGCSRCSFVSAFVLLYYSSRFNYLPSAFCSRACLGNLSPSLLSLSFLISLFIQLVRQSTRSCPQTYSAMSTPPVRQWGVTPPISTVLPTKGEIAANDDLIAELKAQNNFEQPAETERRCVRESRKEDPESDYCDTDNKYCSYSSVSQSNLFKQSVARRDFLRLLSKLLVAKFSHMEVTGWVFMDQVSCRR